VGILTAIWKASVGFAVESWGYVKHLQRNKERCHTTLNPVAKVAVRGGLESTVGITSLDALRCESVAVPSLFIHIMTMGVLAICEPKPLNFGVKHGGRSDINRMLTWPSSQPSCSQGLRGHLNQEVNISYRDSAQVIH